MRNFFGIYQYVTPGLVFPLTYWLWLNRYHGNHAFVLFILSIPIVFSYVIPALGTNWLGLWEINTRVRLGKFRPHHGFLFGTGTSLLALLCFDSPEFSPFGLFRSALVLASVLGFWNWIYDIYAIDCGFITAYNQSYAEGKGAEAIATEHAPVYFGTFGFLYGLMLNTAQHYLLDLGKMSLYWPLLILFIAISLVLPSLAFIGLSFLRHGHSGLKPFEKGTPIGG
ncbi:MAG TPA: hypothetical protein V6C82_01375 [Chroococcales cyanobacterium]